MLPIDTGTDRVAIKKNGTGTDSRAGALFGETILLLLGRPPQISEHTRILWGDTPSHFHRRMFETTVFVSITPGHRPAYFEETVFRGSFAPFEETVRVFRRRFDSLGETLSDLCGDASGSLGRRSALLEETEIGVSSWVYRTWHSPELFECLQGIQSQQPSAPSGSAADGLSRWTIHLRAQKGDVQ
jgi:hypothetical protein